MNGREDSWAGGQTDIASPTYQDSLVTTRPIPYLHLNMSVYRSRFGFKGGYLDFSYLIKLKKYIYH